MIDRHATNDAQSFAQPVQTVRRGRNLVKSVLASVGLFSVGVVGTMAALYLIPGDAPEATIEAPTVAAVTGQVSTAQTLLGIMPTTESPSPAVIAAAPSPVIAAPGLEELVTRSVGTLAIEPIVPTTPAPQVQPVAATAAVPTIIDPTQLFTGASGSNQRGCIDDLRNLTGETRVYFPSGGVSADEQGLVQARLIGFVAQGCPGVIIQVEGHSDPSGDPAVNLRLSEDRARTVLARLASSGVDTSNFRAIGFGDRQPSLIRGTEPSAYYDRRVEFSVVQTGATPVFASVGATNLRPITACVTQLQQATAQTRLFFAPGSITAPQSDLAAVYQLAAAASACPEARLRVIGQFSDDLGSGETPATARLRAVALMSGLVATGFPAEEIIIAAPSRPTVLTNAPGVSERRIDFDVILEEL